MHYGKPGLPLILRALRGGKKTEEVRSIILSRRFLNKLPFLSKENTQRRFCCFNNSYSSYLPFWAITGTRN